MPRRHFLAYLTANDRSYFVADFLNFQRMASKRPGVDRIAVYVAVSRVRPFSPADDAALGALSEIASSCDWLDLRAVHWKGNVGRDFSSAEVCLRAIGRDAGADDYVMVRNRSAYGPFQSGWFKAYVEQYERFPNTGLVGTTVSMQCHPKRPIAGVATHVQTYAYSSQWRHLEPLMDDFPGKRCVDRLELINDGEIGLSRRMLERGLSLSCLNWPSEVFTPERPTLEHLPQVDVKQRVRGLPLRYKYPEYFWQASELPVQLSWMARQLRQRWAPQSPEPAVGCQHVTLDAYD